MSIERILKDIIIVNFRRRLSFEECKRAEETIDRLARKALSILEPKHKIIQTKLTEKVEK